MKYTKAQRGRHGLLRATGVPLVLGLLASCSVLIDGSATQCESDADCASLGAVCDTQNKVCVKTDTSSGGGGNTTTTPQGGGGSGGATTMTVEGGGGAGGNTTMTTTSSTSGTTAPPCADPDSPAIEIAGDISSDFSLTCTNVYVIKGNVHVTSGATLSIEKGTTIKGAFVPPASDPATVAVLVIDPGAKLNAVGTEDEPIVFTSEKAQGSKAKGDWGGVVILGNAPTNHKDVNGNTIQGKVEGIVVGGNFGGINPDDNSGTLKYVRLEYAGYAIGPNNELNGFTFGGVGRGTTLDHLQVRHNDDDCFEFFGGTVNAKYLACQYPTDDGIDWDNGYSGKIQFAVVQQNPNANEDCNGFEGDNDATGTANAPISHPVIYNATLCGQNFDQSKVQYGILVRRRSAATMRNILVSGFETGWDVRNTVDPLVNPIVLQGSVFFGNLANLIAENEPPGSPQDDDAGFDEIAELNKPENGNSTADPMLGNCFDPNAPGFGPAVSLTTGALTPPNDGFFDVTANYTGAFKDAADDWAMKGNWPVWSAQ